MKGTWTSLPDPDEKVAVKRLDAGAKLPVSGPVPRTRGSDSR
jgi:hypothetical protein